LCPASKQLLLHSPAYTKETMKTFLLVEVPASIETAYLSDTSCCIAFLMSPFTLFNGALPSTDYVGFEVLTAVSMNSPTLACRMVRVTKLMGSSSDHWIY
jgi:hypothetical protein